jgi:hypothetical protein
MENVERDYLAEEIAKYGKQFLTETDIRFVTKFKCETIKYVPAWFADYDIVKRMDIPYNHVYVDSDSDETYTHGCILTFEDWHSRYYGKNNC